MTTKETIRPLVTLSHMAICSVCKIYKQLDFEDIEVGQVCGECADQLRNVDVALNYDFPIGLCRPQPGDYR